MINKEKKNTYLIMNEQRYLLVAQIPSWGGGDNELETPPNNKIYYRTINDNLKKDM